MKKKILLENKNKTMEKITNLKFFTRKNNLKKIIKIEIAINVV